ncbi:ATP-grasp domain-containing protein [Patescibacteria group bacterium]|jgi:carbamoyl-phosphate synthase large subunit|nr:ATP-grasp domain-containing protein [Patescibacteria group bacterium]
MAKKKLNVLITCAGGSASLYYAKYLKKQYGIFLADASDKTIARFQGFPFARIPFGNDKRFPSTLHRLVKRWKIDVILPGADEELVPVSQYRAKHPNVTAIIPREDFIKLCLNKTRLMKVLDREGISHLLPYTKASNVRYPAIVKPVYGRGSKGVHRVERASALRGYLELYGKRFSDVLVQPHIEGVEWTVSVIVNDRNRLIGIVPKRVIDKRGITRVAVTERNRVIEELCKKIVERFKPAGPFNVQLKLFKGVPYVFEINPRLSTSSVLTDVAFGNELDLFVKTRGQEKIARIPTMKSGVYLYRYEENVFIRP